MTAEIRDPRLAALRGDSLHHMAAVEQAVLEVRRLRAQGPTAAEQPSVFDPHDKLVGWRLARRGHHRPPDWLVRERPTLAGLAGHADSLTGT